MTFHPNEIAKRARIASVVLIVLFLILGGAFFRTQILLYSHYALLSDQNRLRPIPLPAPRGIIFDRNNEIIAENVTGFTVSMMSKSVDSLSAALTRFSELVPLPPDLVRRLTSPKTFSKIRPTTILSDASFETVSLLMEHKLDFPGLLIQVAPKRFYPDSEVVATIVGYTREITEAQLEQPRYDSAGYKPGQQIGALGLEDYYEATLRGREGTRYLEVDARERVVREDAQPPVEAERGAPLYTNIDLRLQRFISDSIFADTLRAAIVVMEPLSGAVLAMHSSPSFNPNDFIGGISSEKFDALNKDPRLPMYNRTIKGMYPPASTFKLVIAVLALEAGIVSMDTRMPETCNGGLRVGNRVFKCWKKDGHGHATLAEAIEGSCNVYFFQLGQRLGFDKVSEGATRLGFSTRSGIDLPGEFNGLVPNEKYFNERFPGGWSQAAELLNMSIGQGAVTQTVTNMARFYSALATNGSSVKPEIVKGKAPERTPLLNLTPDQLQGVRNALAGVFERGTAGRSAIKELRLAGKTGTAQNPHGRDHGWFVGFAPADPPADGEAPQVLVSVVIEQGEHGSTAAAVASRVFAFHFKQAPIQLSNTGG